MVRTHTHFILLSLLALCSTRAFSAEYMVQIGAYQASSGSAEYSDAATVGGIHYLLGTDSWQKVMIGKFANREVAESARGTLIDMGYQGAFLVNYSSVKDALSSDGLGSDDFNSAGSHDEQQAEESFAETAVAGTLPTATPRTEFSEMDDLSEEEKAMAVYLDGKLRIKFGEQFMTLEEYRQSL